MALSTSSCDPKTTSDQDPLDDARRVVSNILRARFEDLLDDSSSDEGESTMPDTSDKEQMKSGPSQAKRTNNSDAQSQAAGSKRTQSHRSEDDPDEIMLAVIWMKGHLGAAYYNIQTSELFVMEDVMDDEKNHDVMKTLYRQCQPRYVVTYTAVADHFLDAVKKLIVKDAMANSDATTSISSTASGPVRVSLKIVPKTENSYDNCYNRVQCLKLNCEPENATNAERSMFLSSFLNFNSRLMVHALGMLLKYVDVNWNDITLDPNGHAEFIHLNYIMMDDLVMIDDDTYDSLGIVQSRLHPSLFKFGTAASKSQGVSLFTFLNRCQSRPGAIYLWKLLRHPTKNITLLNKRYEMIGYFSNPNNQSIVESLQSCLKNIFRLPSGIINRYSAPQAKVSDWNKLFKTVCQLISIGEICDDHANENWLFPKFAESVTPDMHVVRYFIDYIVDFDQSKIQQRLIVRPGVDPELDELNDTRQRLPELLTEMAEKDVIKYALVMESCRMLYVPDIRYVLAVTMWNDEPPEDDAIPGLEFKFTINGVRHYKSDGARELDDTVGDVLLKITRRQSRIILRLVRFISKHLTAILRSIEICAELDTLLAFAMVARDNNYVMPTMVDSQVINIKKGRHPLKELLVNFVSNDTLSGNGSSLVKVLTGPNASGKTIYLKQIALIVYMAHIGCFVPAESATIGIVTHILMQMNTNDSICQNASSFLLALRQISVALYSSTATSIVIMDEFGSGTSEIDGWALLGAVLKHFIDRGPYCPHIFAATHIQRVLKLLPKSPMIQAQTFEFLTDETNNLVFLHRLINGNTVSSFAHSVAKSAGLAEDIVQRAREVFECRKRGVLPPPLGNSNQAATIKHIMELLTRGGPPNMDDLKLWVRHAMSKPLQRST